ncbi:MAG: MFS transporter [Stellaceae bacterium]
MIEIESRPSAASRPAARLSLFYAAAFMVTGAQLPFWPVWLAARGLGAGQIAALLAAAIWAKVILTPVFGTVADRIGRRRTMVALATIAFIADLSLWPVAGFWPLLLLNLVALAAQSALMPLGDAVTLARARGTGLDYGRIRVWGSVSFIATTLVTGAILAHTSSQAVLAVVLAATALLMLACKSIPADRSARIASDAGRLTRIAGLSGRTRFWGFAVTAAVLQASHQLYYGFGSLYWSSLGFSGTTIGWLWAEGVAAEILLFWLGRHLIRRLGPIGLMALGGIAGVTRWGLAGLVVSLPAIAALQLLHALTFGASYLGTVHFVSRTVPPANAASAQALCAAVSSGVGGLAMIAAGRLYPEWGGHAYWLMALLSAAGLGGALRLRHADPD